MSLTSLAHVAFVYIQLSILNRVEFFIQRAANGNLTVSRRGKSVVIQLVGLKTKSKLNSILGLVDEGRSFGIL